MSSYFRVSLVALVVGAVMSFVASAAQASFGVETFAAVNCKFGHEQCASFEEPGLFPTSPPYSFPEEPEEPEAIAEGFVQAGGRVPYGVTDFELKTEGVFPNLKPEGAPVNRVRVDVASGLATAPVAVPMCTNAEFGETEALPTTGLYPAPTCEAKTEIGTEQVTIYIKELEEKEGFGDLPLAGKVYNLVQPEGLASYYGVALEFPKELTEAKLFEIFGGSEPAIEKAQYYLHSFVKGNVEWGKQAAGTDQGDYHDYFEVEVNPEDPLISSRQVLYGTSPEGSTSAGTGDFITNATSCPGDHTTFVTLKNTEGATTRRSFTTPIPLAGCGSLLFQPSFALSTEPALSDQPDQAKAEVSVPNNPTANAQSQLKTATITLPEGMTLNPSAAHGLEACTPKQAHEEGEAFGGAFGVECPAGSELGTVSLNVPTLPNGSFTGAMYLAGPESGPITGPPYKFYLVANSKRYGVSVRVKGEAIPNEVTGQVTAVFNKIPEQPFTNATLHFNRGVLTSVANPLVCGTPTGSTSFTPVASGVSAAGAAFGVSVTGCASSPLPFAPTQSTENQNGNGGGNTSFTLNLVREDGQQYLSQVSTTLPPGLAGAIPTATQCAEPGAGKGECPSTSQIGTAVVLAGSGATPFTFSGPVYLTGPYDGAPFGLSVAVPAIAGPFNLGTVVTRATLNVNQYTARVTVANALPRIFKGIPLRLRRITVSINKQGFLYNPTNCGALATESAVTGFVPGTSESTTVNLSSPFQLANCTALAFTPKFTAKTSGKTSKANGASIETTLNYAPGQANTRSVLVQLPKQLPSRLTTLQKACLAATFEANPFACPSGSFVGGARANTLLLPGKLTGPAILVSHGGESFPSLELVLQADGVRVIVVGKTDIKKGITTTNFATTPDAPVSSITVSLPLGPHSALATERLTTNLCTAKLVMPTTITAQNGKQLKQNTVIQPTGCGVQIVGHKIVGNTAYLTVKTFAAGRISGGGSGLSTVFRRLRNANKAAALKLPLSGAGRSRGRPFKTKIRVGFVPKKKGPTSVAYVTVEFG